MSDETKKDPCPVCAERARKRAELAHEPRTSLDFVYCPMCDNEAKCRVTGGDCDGRLVHEMRHDENGSMVEDIGFPCQELATRMVRLVQKRPTPVFKLAAQEK